LLKSIDRKIQTEKDELIFKKAQISIDSNFLFPSLTQYILSEATNRNDLLTVVMQLKSDGKINRIIRKIDEIASSIKGTAKLQREIDSLIKNAFGKRVSNISDLNVGLSILFFSISKSVNLSYFNRKEYLIFLKNLVVCRSEAFRLEKDIERVFNIKIK
jgi:hypothetical protein